MSSPTWSRLLLSRLLPEDRRDDVLGDFEEVHQRRARRQGAFLAWFRSSLDTLALAWTFFLYRWREQEWNGVGLTWTEVRVALRMLRRQPLLAATTILALAAGIALATTGFTLLDAITHGELPFSNGERFVRIAAHQLPEGHRSSMDWEHFLTLRDHAQSFEHLGAVRGANLNILQDDGRVDAVEGAWITPQSMTHLPYAPVLGRNFLAADGQAGALPVVLIRESLWRRLYGGAKDALGQEIDLSGARRTIVGILADSAKFPTEGEVWLPLPTASGEAATNEEAIDATVFGILASDSDLASAGTEVSAVSANLFRQRGREADLLLEVRSYVEGPREATLLGSVMVTVLVSILLVIAANVANLVLARTVSRRGELAMRGALGAGRWRLILQLTLEVGLLCAVASLLGLAASRATLLKMDGLMSELPFWIDLSPSPRALLFTLGITLLACLIGGVLPARKALGRTPGRSILAGSRNTGSLGLGRLGLAMMVFEMAISVALLSAALVLAEGFDSYFDTDLELPPGQVLTAQVWEAQASEEPTQPLWTKLEASLQRIPGTVTVGISNTLPRYDAPSRRIEIDRSEMDGRAIAAGSSNLLDQPLNLPVAAVSRDFLPSLDAEALTGRLFRDTDFLAGAKAVAIVNQPFARKFFAEANPIGRQIREIDGAAGQNEDERAASGPWREIIGVVPDLGLSASDPERAAGLYVPLAEDPSLIYLTLRTHGDPALLSAPLRRAVVDLDPNLQLSRVQPLEEVNSEERIFLQGFSKALAAMGGLTLLLSLLGLYATISFAVAGRTREIGIRVALGASRGRVLRAVVGGTSWILAAGAALGALLGALALRAQDSILAIRLPTDRPEIILAVVFLLLSAGILACWIPVRRALGIQPTEALRES